MFLNAYFRFFLCCTLLCGLLLSLAGCGTQIQNALKVQDALSEAFRHAQVDPDDKQAREWADRAIAIAPNDPSTYLGMAAAGQASPGLSIEAVFHTVGDDPALADYMQQAVQKFPDDDRGDQFLIDAEGRLGRVADQKANAAKLVALLTKKLHAPGATDIEYLTLSLAQAQIDSGDLAGGIAAYQKAIPAYPADPAPPNQLAYAFAVANTRLPEALSLAQQALKLAHAKSDTPEEVIAAYQDTLGWVQYRQGDYKDAEQNLQEAADGDPREAELRYHLGMVYIAEGKTDAARAELGHAVLLSSSYAAAQQALDSLPKTAVPST